MPAPAREIIAPGYIGPERRADPCADVRADCEGRFDALEKWQTRQNGSLVRIEEHLDKGISRVESKIDRMFYAVLAAGLGALVTIVVKFII